jgi:hypothetical protein
MDFKTIDEFIRVCSELPKTHTFDSYVAAKLHYNQEGQAAKIKMVDALFEHTIIVSINRVTKNQFSNLNSYLNQRFISQFPDRFATFQKPTPRIITEYEDWKEFRDNWLIRKGKNLTRYCIPLLFDIYKTKNKSGLFATLYITKTGEFYKFSIPLNNKNQLKIIKSQLQKLIEEVYVA